MAPVTITTVDRAGTSRAGLVGAMRDAVTLIARRPGLALAAGTPAFVVGFVDAFWIAPLPDRLAWVELLWLPLGAGAFTWTLALFAAAWEAEHQSPAAIVVARAGELLRTTLLFLVIFVVGVPLVFPAIYYGVHYYFFPIVAVRDPARRSLALLRRSKLLARRHRSTTWTLVVALTLWSIALPFLCERLPTALSAKQ